MALAGSLPPSAGVLSLTDARALGTGTPTCAIDAPPRRWRILHVTDIHLDPTYVAGAEAHCSEPPCCQANSVTHPTQVGDHSASTRHGSQASRTLAVDAALQRMMNRALTRVERGSSTSRLTVNIPTATRGYTALAYGPLATLFALPASTPPPDDTAQDGHQLQCTV